MKLDRLLRMIVLLLHHRRMKAQDLARELEVSVRTIYRDMETLGQSGIPVVTFPGTGGGIGLAEGYRLTSQVMTEEEWASILMALRSMSSTPAAELGPLLDKIHLVLPENRRADLLAKSESVFIDHSSWELDPYTEAKIELLRRAIENGRTVWIAYTNRSGESGERIVEPHTLVWKGMCWYLHAFCLEKQDFRLFKLSRMREVKEAESFFQRRATDAVSLPWMKSWQPAEPPPTIVMRFTPELRASAEEQFGVEQVKLDEHGYATVSFAYPEEEWLYGFLMSFGPGAEVLEPVRIRELLRIRSEQFARVYRQAAET